MSQIKQIFAYNMAIITENAYENEYYYYVSGISIVASAESSIMAVGRVILLALVVVLVLGAVTAQNEDERVAYSSCVAQCEADRGNSGTFLTSCDQQCDHDLQGK